MNCPICEKNEIGDEETSCFDCVMTGRYMEFCLTEPVRKNVLTRIRELSDVNSANLWPTMPGAFVIGIMKGEKTLIAGSKIGVLEGEIEDAEVKVSVFAPAIPPMGEPWLVVSHETPGDMLAMCDGDDELVEAVKQA